MKKTKTEVKHKIDLFENARAVTQEDMKEALKDVDWDRFRFMCEVRRDMDKKLLEIK